MTSMSRYGYTYLTTNIVNGDVYIGQRMGEFDPAYLGSGIYLKRAIKKYGRENFRVSVMEYADSKDRLNMLEKKYISECRQYLGKDRMYNIADGGDGGNLGDDVIQKMKRTKAEHPQIQSKESNESRRKALLGRNRSDAFKEKMRQIALNRPSILEETRKKLCINHANVSENNNPFFGKHHTEKSKELNCLKHLVNKQTDTILTMEFLSNEYIKKKVPYCTIASMVGCDPKTVKKRLIKYNIPVRYMSESKRKS